MWRAIICLSAALTLGIPAVCHAQYFGNDSQHPKEYTNQDSQPLRLAAYVLSPIGFLLEWGVARPLHYVATDTFLAPALGGKKAQKQYVPPLPPLPPEAGSPPPTVTAELPPSQVTQGTAAAPPKSPAPKSAVPSAPAGTQQPILH